VAGHPSQTDTRSAYWTLGPAPQPLSADRASFSGQGWSFLRPALGTPRIFLGPGPQKNHDESSAQCAAAREALMTFAKSVGMRQTLYFATPLLFLLPFKPSIGVSSPRPIRSPGAPTDSLTPIHRTEPQQPSNSCLQPGYFLPGRRITELGDPGSCLRTGEFSHREILESHLTAHLRLYLRTRKPTRPHTVHVPTMTSLTIGAVPRRAQLHPGLEPDSWVLAHNRNRTTAGQRRQ
jgi:hypothetical protein